MKRAAARWLGLALIAVVFAGGVGVGIAVDRLWLGGGEPEVGSIELPRRLARFSRRLDLTREQERRIREILEATRSRIGAETASAKERILEVLTPEQGARYLELVERRERRRGHHRRKRRR
jgi:Spy/CpxP family protein refolding chaperone